MTYKEATELAIKSKWKTAVCISGEECWCRMIVTEEPIKYKYQDSEEPYDASEIVSAGAIDKECAEQIVKDHNQNLNNCN